MVIDHTMFTYHRQNPSKWWTVVLTAGLLPVLRICRLLATVVAAKFKQRAVSLLQLHDRHKRKQPGCVCVCVFFPPLFPLWEGRLSIPSAFPHFAPSHPHSDPKRHGGLAQADIRSASIDSLRISHRSRISQPRFNGFTGPLGVINRKVYGVNVLRDNSITTQPVLILKTQSRR